MKTYLVDLTFVGTAFIKAETEDKAIEIADRLCADDVTLVLSETEIAALVVEDGKNWIWKK